MAKPGITNLPALLTCAAPISPRASRIFEHSDFFISDAVAKASAIPPFVKATPAALGFALMAFMICFAFVASMAFMAFMAFIAFIAGLAAFIAFIAAMVTKMQCNSCER